MCRARDRSAGGFRSYVQCERGRVTCPRCRGVYGERLDWLATNPRVTPRFAMHVGARCREMTTTAVADAARIHDRTVKHLDTLDMRQQVARVGLPAPRAIGVEEIAIRKGHASRIVVSDLDRGRPIWVGGTGRTEADVALLFATLGAHKTARIPLAAMDRWRPCRTSLARHAPQARVLFDQFHLRRHLGDALDEGRRRESHRLTGKARACIKGQRDALLSRRENLSHDGRANLRQRLTANKRRHTAYLLKESLGPLWSYHTPGGARAFFERWTQRLTWPRLKPYEQFAAMIERHGDGIVSYCHPKNKVSLGLVEGRNNTIRVLQRRAYGYRDAEYLTLKIVATFLHPLPQSAEKDPL